MNTITNGYDIIGDIHGYASELKALLAKMGYVERSGIYRHPGRTAIFIGDFIDRGPNIRETLQIVRAMVDSGAALAVMGNHEYNSLCFDTEDDMGGYLRPRSEKNVRQHRATLDQLAGPYPEEWRDYLKWFKELPLFLDLGSLRIVHACWDAKHIATLNGSHRLSDELLVKSAKKGSSEFRAVDALLKGKELELPDGQTFTDKDGTARREIRTKWWLGGEGRTYFDLSFFASDTVPKLAVPEGLWSKDGYSANEPPILVGHYWLPPAQPALLAENIACVDYSVAKDGMLVAYRWDGESNLDAGKFTYVESQGRRGGPSSEGETCE